jgi:hypothetical protein
MDTLRIVQFDIHGKNPVNKFVGEKMPIQDKTCPWVIPDASPFFGDYPKNGQLPLTVVYDQRGTELKRDRDYWLEEEFMPLVEVTGRPIVCFVRLSDEIREENEYVTINYQSVGAYFVPRNSIEEWMYEMHKGNIPVPWSKVFGVPATLPPEWHGHSIKTEIGDWYELTWFYTYLAGIVSTRDPAVSEDLNDAIRAAFDQLYAVRDAQQARLKAHDSNYNVPHGPTKDSVNMGNHPNYRTASLAEQKAGTSATLLSTPQGAQELLKDYIPDTSEAMRAGILPVSKFSNGGYIPPIITGSFEGLGSRSECMGICIEPDGRTVIIQNHFDGRNEGLYFSTLSDYNGPFNPNKLYDFIYTAYKYEPPVLTNIGVEPDAIIMGSGNDIIMVGQTYGSNPTVNDKWYLALTNNSFDPAGHRYIKVNMAPVYAQIGAISPTSKLDVYPYHGRMSVNLIDDWAILVVESHGYNTDGGIHSAGRLSFWRIPKQALIDATPATWELIKITYPDYDGVVYSNYNHWEYAQRQIVNGGIVRWGRYTFSPIPLAANTNGQFSRRILPMMAKKTGAANVAYLNVVLFTFFDYTPPGLGFNPVQAITNVVYEINLATGAMTSLYTQPTFNVDYNDPVGWVNERTKMMNWYNYTVRFVKQAVITTPQGETVGGVTDDAAEMVPLNSFIQTTKWAYSSSGQVINSREELLRGHVGTDRIKAHNIQLRRRNILTPVPIGLSTRYLAYEFEGENFVTTPTTINRPANAGIHAKVVCRNVSGDYAIRPQVSNINYGQVYSRPLVNTVYDTNMSVFEAVISITGSAAELAARGVGAGNMSMACCGWSSASLYMLSRLTLPSEAFQAPNPAGAFLTFPKTYRRTLDVANQKMMYEPNDYYGLSESFKAKVRSLIPPAKQGAFWSFTVNMLDGAVGGMFAGLNSAILHMKYPERADASSPILNARLLHIRPIVEAPNANHPGCYLITDFQVLSDPGEYVQLDHAVPSRAGWSAYLVNRGMLSMYRTGNTFKAAYNSAFVSVTGTQLMDLTIFDLDIGTGAITNLGGTVTDWVEGDAITNIPKVGRTRGDVVNRSVANRASITELIYSSGGACRIFPVVNGADTSYYATITAYPEVAWAIFFLEEVELMINGTMHRMPTGIQDLRDLDPAPQNKKYWVYATIVGEKGHYIISDTKLRQSGKLIHAATVTTGPNQILLIERRQPFMIGDLELSYSRKGGIIPVSSGFPQDDGNFTFLRAAELLP